MIQRVCEKCGAVIEKPNRRNIIGYEPHYLRFHLFKKPDEAAELESAVDLCDRCRDLFDDWLMEPPKEEQQ